MFSAPLEVNFHVGSIRENFGQHPLTNMSQKAPKNVKNIENSPLAVCNIDSCQNGTSANVGVFHYFMYKFTFQKECFRYFLIDTFEPK